MLGRASGSSLTSWYSQKWCNDDLWDDARFTCERHVTLTPSSLGNLGWKGSVMLDVCLFEYRSNVSGLSFVKEPSGFQFGQEPVNPDYFVWCQAWKGGDRPLPVPP